LEVNRLTLSAVTVKAHIRKARCYEGLGEINNALEAIHKAQALDRQGKVLQRKGEARPNSIIGEFRGETTPYIQKLQTMASSTSSSSSQRASQQYPPQSGYSPQQQQQQQQYYPPPPPQGFPFGQPPYPPHFGVPPVYGQPPPPPNGGYPFQQYANVNFNNNNNNGNNGNPNNNNNNRRVPRQQTQPPQNPGNECIIS